MGQHAEDALNEILDGPYGHWGKHPPVDVECRRCGKSGLTWEDDNGRWRLVDGHGKVHSCDPARVAKLVAADFKPLD